MKFWNVAVAFFVFMTTNLAVYRRDWREKLTAHAKGKSFETMPEVDKKPFKFKSGTKNR
jgi:hypothetical protein